MIIVATFGMATAAKNDRSILYWDIKKPLDELELKGPLRTFDEDRIYKILSAAAENKTPDEIEGVEFDPEAKGASLAKSRQVSKWIRDFFQKDAINYSKIRLVLNRPTAGIYIKWDELEAVVSLDDCMVNEEYVGVLEKYKIYAEEGQYPFIVINHEDLETCIKYPLFRVVAGLPHYSLLDINKRLPTVDHINRCVMDTSNENLRYCNVNQNGYNHCIAKVAFHGGAKGSIIPAEGTVMFGVYLWGVMFDYFVSHADGDIDKVSFLSSWEKNPVIDKDGCRYNEDTMGPWVGVMNQFAISVLKWARTTDDIYNRSTTLSQMDVSKGFLKSVHSFFVDGIRPSDGRSSGEIYKTVFVNDFVKALTYDLVKVVEAGEFAHTNFLKVPKPSSYVPIKVVDPLDILNDFEHTTSFDHLRKGLMNMFSQLKNELVISSVYSYCAERKCIVAKFGMPNQEGVVLKEVPNKVDYLIKTPNCFYIVE